MTAQEPWYHRAFDASYLAVYSHRDDVSADLEVRWAMEVLGLRPDEQVVDLGCGAGRHVAAARSRGLRCVGIDLSAALLAHGRRTHGPLALARGHLARVPLRDSCADGTWSLFTSFGYDSTAMDQTMLAEVRRILRPGRRHLLDFLNQRRVREELVPESRSRCALGTLLQRRRIEDGWVCKDLELTHADGSRESWNERVRLYDVTELEALVETAGLEVVDRFGDLAGSPFTPSSPRLVIVSRRQGA